MAEQMVRNESQGYVLHMRPYRNTSAIIDAFTYEYGRVHFVAKGIKNVKSKFYSLLHQFQELRLAWQGNGDLYTLTNVEQLKMETNVIPDFGGSSNALASAYYCNELIMRFFGKEDPHPEFYDFYKKTLVQLFAGGQLEMALRLFEKELLLQTGYALNFLYDAHTGEVLEENASYYFSPDVGAVRTRTNEMISEYKVSGKTLLALANDTLHDERILKEAKHLMRFVISGHIGDKPLKTRKFVMQEIL